MDTLLRGLLLSLANIALDWLIGLGDTDLALDWLRTRWDELEGV